VYTQKRYDLEGRIDGGEGNSREKIPPLTVKGCSLLKDA
jgi:hypothetical protein